MLVVQMSCSRSVVVFRPGVCAGTSSGEKFKVSNEFPDETLNFIKIHPLMDEAVPSIANRPWFLKTMVRWAKHLQINYALRSLSCKYRLREKDGWIESFASDSLRLMDVFFRISLKESKHWRLFSYNEVDYGRNMCLFSLKRRLVSAWYVSVHLGLCKFAPVKLNYWKHICWRSVCILFSRLLCRFKDSRDLERWKKKLV